MNDYQQLLAAVCFCFNFVLLFILKYPSLLILWHGKPTILGLCP
jgi:hypothetical protein